MVPFHVEVPEAELIDLRARLERTRWPEREPVDDWSQGVPLAYLQDLCDHWAHGYDWRATDARLNALPQLRTEIDGLDIHFIHVRSRSPDALALVLTHGWPGSIVEFLKVIGPLSDDFHVVCPSLPGYGFSDRPQQPGWGIERIARAWIELMARLGYKRYGAQGSDWGTSISTRIAQLDPDHVVGIHRGCTPRVRRPSATRSWTPPPACSRGSSRSSGPGPTATAIPRTHSRATRCSTT